MGRDKKMEKNERKLQEQKPQGKLANGANATYISRHEK